MNIRTARIGLMMDIETLGTDADAIVTQTALYGWDLLDPETILPLPHFQYIPIQPQMELIPARKVEASTIIWHMKQGTDLSNNDSSEFSDLPTLLKHFLRAFERLTDCGVVDYELWTRGMFDTVIMKSLLKQCGFECPWDFRRERDLRTLESISGVSYKEVPEPAGYVKHNAAWDCRFQIAHHTACMAALGKAK